MAHLRITGYGTAEELREEFAKLIGLSVASPKKTTLSIHELAATDDASSASAIHATGGAGGTFVRTDAIAKQSAENQSALAQQNANNAASDVLDAELNKPKRTRRTKAEMEADRAPAVQLDIEQVLATQTGGPVAPDPEAAKAPNKAPTIDDGRAALQRLMTKSPGEVFPLLATFKTADGTPAKKISQMDPNDFGALIAKCDEMVAA